MKNKILISIVVLSAFFSSSAFANLSGLPARYSISSDRRSVQLQLTNSQGSDQICETLEMDVLLGGNEYNDVVGGFTLDLGPQYLLPGATVTLTDLGSEEIRLSDLAPKPVILKVEMRQSCRKANFADYCKHAPKSDAEKHTIEQIVREVRKNACDLIEAAVDKNLDLRNRQIVDVRPIGFLTKLKNLRLSDNKIEDLAPLKNLIYLRKLDIQKNPIEDIQPVINLPSIEQINANRTSVYYEDNLKGSPSLKWLYLDHTPYSKKIRKK